MRNLLTILLLLPLTGNAAIRTYGDGTTLQRGDTLTVSLGDDFVAFEVRAALTSDKARRGLSANSWTLSLDNGVEMTLRSGNDTFGDRDSRPFTRVSVTLADSTIYTIDLTEGMAQGSGAFNTMAADYDPIGDMLSLATGATTLNPVTLLPTTKPSKAHISATAPLDIAWTMIETQSVTTPGIIDPDEIHQAIALSTDPRVAVWHYFDRENDPQLARPGGKYTLATVPDDEGGYWIVCLDGADVNPEAWPAGAVKGRLRPSTFKDRYTLDWTEATLAPAPDESSATFTVDYNLLTLNFPLLKSTLRFSKLR